MLWNDDYKTGIKEIDEQHIKWIQITVSLLTAVLIGSDKQKIVGILKDSIKYAAQHFKYEENLLKINNYPDLKQHIV